MPQLRLRRFGILGPVAEQCGAGPLQAAEIHVRLPAGFAALTNLPGIQDADSAADGRWREDALPVIVRLRNPGLPCVVLEEPISGIARMGCHPIPEFEVDFGRDVHVRLGGRRL